MVDTLLLAKSVKIIKENIELSLEENNKISLETFRRTLNYSFDKEIISFLVSGNPKQNNDELISGIISILDLKEGQNIKLPISTFDIASKLYDSNIIKTSEDFIDQDDREQHVRNIEIFRHGYKYQVKDVYKYGWNEIQRLVIEKIEKLKKDYQSLEKEISNVTKQIHNLNSTTGSFSRQQKFNHVESTRILCEKSEKINTVLYDLSSLLILEDQIEDFRNSGKEIENPEYLDLILKDEKYKDKEIDNRIYEVEKPLMKLPRDALILDINRIFGGDYIITNGRKTEASILRKYVDFFVGKGRSINEITDSVRGTFVDNNLEDLILMSEITHFVANKYAEKQQVDFDYDKVNIYKGFKIESRSFFISSKINFFVNNHVSETKFVEEKTLSVKKAFCDKLYSIQRQIQPEVSQDILMSAGVDKRSANKGSHINVSQTPVERLKKIQREYNKLYDNLNLDDENFTDFKLADVIDKYDIKMPIKITDDEVLNTKKELQQKVEEICFISKRLQQFCFLEATAKAKDPIYQKMAFNMIREANNKNLLQDSSLYVQEKDIKKAFGEEKYNELLKISPMINNHRNL
jgi:FtsZ-binding cell division protein ZapB